MTATLLDFTQHPLNEADFSDLEHQLRGIAIVDSKIDRIVNFELQAAVAIERAFDREIAKRAPDGAPLSVVSIVLLTPYDHEALIASYASRYWEEKRLMGRRK